MKNIFSHIALFLLSLWKTVASGLHKYYRFFCKRFLKLHLLLVYIVDFLHKNVPPQIDNSRDDGNVESPPNPVSLVLDEFSAVDGAVRLGL